MIQSGMLKPALLCSWHLASIILGIWQGPYRGCLLSINNALVMTYINVEYSHCPGGGIGRRARFRIWYPMDVRVRPPPRALFYFIVIF